MLDYLSQSLLRYVGNQTIQDVLRQVAVILVSVIVVWGLARWGGRAWLRFLHTFPDRKRGILKLGGANFIRVFSPVLMFLVLLVGQMVMMKLGYSVSLWHLAFPVVLSQLLIRLVSYMSHRIFVKGRQSQIFVQQLNKIFTVIVWIGVMLYIMGMWGGLIQLLNSAEFTLGRYQITVLMILQACVSVLVTMMMALWISALIEEKLLRSPSVHSSLRMVLSRLVRGVLVLIAILVSLSLVGIDLTVLSVFGGALGVGLGLGLQKIASSYISGFVILFERSLSIGDVVDVDQYFGKVTKINTRYTVLQGLDGIESVLPNDTFMTRPVKNFSLTDRLIRLSTNLTIVYEKEIQTVLRILEEAALTVERVSKVIKPQALLLKLGVDGLEIQVGFWISDPENGRLNVLSEVNLAIWQAFEQHHIALAHPKRDIRLSDGKSFIQHLATDSEDSPKVG